MKPRHLAPRHLGAALVAVAVLAVGSLAIHGAARADIDVRLDIGNAPTLSGFYFNAPPHRVYDASSGVYVVDDPDVGDMDAFQYGGYYWVFNDGFWYRSADWRDGFEAVQPQYVPTQLYSVPDYRWKHHPSYDSWHYRGWRTRDWNDRAHMSTTQDREWDDNGRVTTTPTYQGRVYTQPTRTYRTYDNGTYYDTQVRTYRYKVHHTPKVRVTVKKHHHHDYDDNGDRSY